MSSDLDLRFGRGGAADVSSGPRDLLMRAALCFKLATLHNIHNNALRTPVANLLGAINGNARGGELRLQSVRDSFFLNRVLIPVDARATESGKLLRAILRRLAVHEIAFRGSFSEEDLLAVLAAFQARYWGSNRGSKPGGELTPKCVLRVVGKAQRYALLRQGDRRRELLKAYAAIALAMRDAMAAVEQRQPIPVPHLRREVQLLADASEGQDALLIALTFFGNPKREAHYHPVAVGALVMMMARFVGASHRLITELPVNAMLHDIARAKMSDPFAFGSEVDENQMRFAASARERLPLRSLLEITSGELSLEALSRASLAYEVTQPPSDPERVLDPTSVAALVAVASAFQHLRAPAQPRRGMTPDRALRFILERAGTRFDARAARVLASSVGLYPVGTLVRLSTGEVAVVADRPSLPAYPTYPPVRVVRNASGDVDEWIDLGKDGTGQMIVATLDPIEEGVSIPHVFIAGKPPPAGAEATPSTDLPQAEAPADLAAPEPPSPPIDELPIELTPIEEPPLELSAMDLTPLDPAPPEPAVEPMPGPAQQAPPVLQARRIVSGDSSETVPSVRTLAPPEEEIQLDDPPT